MINTPTQLPEKKSVAIHNLQKKKEKKKKKIFSVLQLFFMPFCQNILIKKSKTGRLNSMH